jgi:hypothetical protein
MNQYVDAIRVSLTSSVVCDERNNIGNVWKAGAVKSLVVFPDSHNARCVIGGVTLVAVYSSYVPVASSQQQWEGATEFVCEDCGRTFANAQGLGAHRVTQHGKKSK